MGSARGAPCQEIARAIVIPAYHAPPTALNDDPKLSMKQDLSRFVQPGRVHRQIYTDPAIFELELERIFGAAWIYIGHESQVKNPGDYFSTRIGRKPVVLVRDSDRRVHVIHNQ